MPIRTTIVISEEAYKRLVEMAIEKYGHAKAISKVIESLVTGKDKGNPKKIIEKAKKIRVDINLTPEEIDRLVEEAIEKRVKI